MPNYIIDCSINFYEELIKEQSETENIDENNLCLLSNLPLDETFVTLPCNHKFNYIYIFNEVKNSKKNNFLNSNYYSKPLLPNEIRCPYCRQSFFSLLPPCKHIKGTSILKNINSNSSVCLNIKCKGKTSKNTIECSNNVYVTPLGHYCNNHYNKLNIKNKQGVSNKSIKTTKEIKIKNAKIKKSNFLDSSFNNVNLDSSNNIIVNNMMENSELIDVSELEYYIGKKYTIPQLKDIINKYNSTSKLRVKVGGSKSELIKRIIDYEMIPLNIS